MWEQCLYDARSVELTLFKCKMTIKLLMMYFTDLGGSMRIHGEIGNSRYFHENVKIRQRLDEVIVYGTDMMRELTSDCATFKSFEGYTDR